MCLCMHMGIHMYLCSYKLVPLYRFIPKHAHANTHPVSTMHSGGRATSSHFGKPTRMQSRQGPSRVATWRRKCTAGSLETCKPCLRPVIRRCRCRPRPHLSARLSLPHRQRLPPTHPKGRSRRKRHKQKLLAAAQRAGGGRRAQRPREAGVTARPRRAVTSRPGKRRRRSGCRRWWRARRWGRTARAKGTTCGTATRRMTWWCHRRWWRRVGPSLGRQGSRGRTSRCRRKRT